MLNTNDQFSSLYPRDNNIFYSQQHEKSISYWKALFDTPPLALELPTDRYRPTNSTRETATHTFTFPPVQLHALNTFCQQERIPLHTILLTAFQSQLHYYTGQHDFVLCTNISAHAYPQTLPSLANTPDLFPLRCNLADQPNVSLLLHRTQDNLLAAYTHLDGLTLATLLEELYPAQPVKQQAFSQVQLTFVSHSHYVLPDRDNEQSAPASRTHSADLALHFEHRTEELTCQFAYSIELFDHTTIVRMVGHLLTSVAAMLANPQSAIAHLPFMTTSEREQILLTWNDTKKAYAYEQCLHQLIEAQVARTPTAPAVIFATSQLSYRELDTRANQLAHYLQRSGVGPDVLVGVYMERSLELVIALLGILKAGGAYVPLDPTYPAERLNFMLNNLISTAHNQPSVLLTQARLITQLPTSHAHVISLDSNWTTIAQEATTPPINQATPYNLAYVIYTSGSTGKPKGAMNTHRAICNRLLWMQDAYQLSAADAILQKTPFSFDVSVWEFFWPLLTGARLVVARPEGHKDSAYLISLIQDQQITTLHFVPSMLQIFLEEPGLEECSTLRQVICSGEALSFDLQERFFARHNAALYNLYGPTEAAVDVTHWTCQRVSERNVVPIGYPIANTQLYILNRYGQPVPIGVQGELFIGGVGVARGYLNRPELTAERFVENPFSTQTSTRLYRTGDLARYLPDGAIEYLGRLDHQVKLRGFRIELGEIEAVLALHPSIREAVATIYGNTASDKRLVAYLVLHKEPGPSFVELQQHVQQHLPPYMLPSTFIILPTFPLNPSGKVNRAALPDPDDTRPDLHQAFLAPATTTEELMASIWSEVLGIKQIGVHDNFFALGGHSLLAMQVISKLRTILQVELPLHSFFDAPTIAQLVELILQQQQAGQHKITRPVLQAHSRQISEQHIALLQASFAQEALWFIDQLNPGDTAYNLPATLRLHKPLQIQVIQHCLDHLVERHEALRTTFTAIDGQPMQVIATHLDIPITFENLQNLPEAEREVALQGLATRELQKPFDLAYGPLLRMSVLQLGQEEHLLLFVMHHSIADGWTINLLLQELITLYTAFTSEQPANLPALPLQFADFALWQRASLQDEVLTKLLAYWKQQLADAPPILELPTDRPRSLKPTQQGAMHTFTLSPTLSTKLKTLSRQENVTLYMTLVAAFVTLLQRYSGQDDILLGSTVAGRNHAEVEPLVGYFINTVVLRTDLSGNPTVRDLLARVREVTLAASDHQDMPFEILVKELQPDRSMGQSPLFQAFLTLAPSLPEVPADWDINQLDLATGSAKFDLALELTERPQGIVAHLEYSTNLFDAPTIARMSGHWQILLQAIVSDPTQYLATLPLVTEAERQLLLVDWNNTQAIYPGTYSIAQLFAEQVARTPDEVALIFENSSLSYRDLNRQANQLARYLQRCGAQPAMRIGLCIERSLEMVIALLAILKTGGIYVPLDPTYPSERLAFMLQDAQLAILLTQQKLADHLPRYEGTTIYIDSAWPQIIEEQPENLAHSEGGENLAYMLYTSGSTGTPKGVLGTHRACINRFNWMWRTYPFTTDEVCCQKTTLSFVDSVWEIFGPLLKGIKSVIIPDTKVQDPELFLTTLSQHRVTRIVLVPSLLRVLLDQESKIHTRLPALKYWICSGEALPLELAQRFQQQLPDALLLNLYGSSEVAADATYYVVPNDRALSCIPIGRPIDNTCIYILDQQMQLLPPTIPGELYIGGAGLAHGYFNRPTLTDERFVTDPFSNETEATLYKTGDQARYLPDGNIEYLGRLDQQIKLRGMRIEPGEIESLLRQHPAIHEAVVIVREDTPADQRLVAYIVPQQGQQPEEQKLQQHLSTYLPAYMLPAAFVSLEKLPLTHNGKINRRSLPPPTQSRDTTRTTYIAPQLTIHYQLVQIWEELLNVHPIGIRDNFFKLGGHSLLATRLMSRIQQVIGKQLPIATLFAGATIEHLANVIQSEEPTSKTRTPITAVQASGSKPPFFFLHGDWQGKALYCLKLAHALGEDQPFYILETYQYTDLDVLPSLKEIAAAHIAALRTVQPTGPYRLGGWCNGALFAYEMAQQLQQAGEEVEIVVMMDPGSSTPSGRLIQKFFARNTTHQQRSIGWFLRLLHIYEYARLWREHKAREAVLRRATDAELAEIEAAHPNFQLLLPSSSALRQNYISIFNWWASNYQIKPYSGKIAVFWTEEDGPRRRKDWSRILAGKPDVASYIVPGNHVTSRTKYSAALAQALRDCLQKLEE